MKIIRAFAVAFSMYSRIPMPQFPWKDEDQEYMLCFFPWVGGVIGGLLFLWEWFCREKGLSLLCEVLAGAAIPLLVTGGFHADGFLDTVDAFHSFRPREKKLEILKDPHVGAFALIRFGLYGLLYLAFLSEVQERSALAVVCCGFFLARCLSGISVVSFPQARKDGMLSHAAMMAKKKTVRLVLGLQGAFCVALMLWISVPFGVAGTLAALLSFGYYYWRSRKELSGITGDTAGYFILVCEESILAAAAILDILLR